MTKLWRGLCKNWQVLIGLAWFFGTGSLPFWVPSVLPTLKVSPESLRGLGLYLLGTGTAPLGLYLTYSRTASLRSQADNEKDKNVTDAFAKSAELLDSKSRAGRQGGIYALEKIAKDNPERHSTIMKIMISYIRGETYQRFHERLNEEDLIDKLAKEPMPSDIEAAIEVVRERQINNDESLKSDEAAIEVVKERQTNNDESLKSDEKKSFKPKFDLSNSYVFNADFSATNLSNTNFSDSIMFGCCFDRTDLSESSFVSSNLQGSSFVGSKFKKCEFKKTNFQECDFQECDLSDSEFENCDLTDVKNLTQEQIDSVKVDRATKLPRGIRYPRTS